MKSLVLAGVLLTATAASALAQSPNGVRTLNPPGAIKVEGTWSLGARAHCWCRRIRPCCDTRRRTEINPLYRASWDLSLIHI